MASQRKKSASRKKASSTSSSSKKGTRKKAARGGGSSGGGGGSKKTGARRRRPSAARTRTRRAGWSRAIRVAGRLLAAGAFVVGFVCAGWLLSLDRIVVARFEGHTFDVPSRVMSAPTILYPGLDVRRVGLRESFERLGYREAGGTKALAPGRFRDEGGRLRVHLRAFDHPTRAEPARDITVLLRGGVIQELRDYPSGRESGPVLLEPELIGAFYGDDREQRELVRIDGVPRHLIDAVLAVEDRRFETHHGIDFRRILGALVANIRAGGIAQGGSTLTQQLVKNFFLTPDRTLWRKLQEAAMAVLVEARYEKPEILQAYLNEIYLGQRGSTAVHGVGEAARFFWGKRIADVTVAESALLAAIIQSPNRLSPHRNADRAKERRDLVLNLMFEQGRISESAHAEALEAPVLVSRVTAEPGDARYFLDFLRRQLPEVYDEDVLAGEGLRIYSTLDWRLQRAAAAALRKGLSHIEDLRPVLAKRPADKRLEGCLIALRPQTGEIVALVGGRDYGRSQFDRCTQARRQVGSAFKPFAYLAALEDSGDGPVVTLADYLDDSPLEIETSRGTWRPENYDHDYRGSVTVREALERSLNVPAARLGQRVGIDKVARMARRLGIDSKLPRVPSLVLGTAEVSPIEIARAYATLANGGVRPWPHGFEDVVAGERGTLEKRKLRFERVIDSGTAYLGVSLLEGVVDRGTARGVRSRGMKGAIAAKTGTTDDEYDLWFVGFTPELLAVVWVGFDEPSSIGLASSSGALPIWVDFMREAVGTSVRGDFLMPPQVERVAIDPLTGTLAGFGCPRETTEYFLAGTEPTEVCGRPRRPRRRNGGWFDWIRKRL